VTNGAKLEDRGARAPNVTPEQLACRPLDLTAGRLRRQPLLPARATAVRFVAAMIRARASHSTGRAGGAFKLTSGTGVHVGAACGMWRLLRAASAVLQERGRSPAPTAPRIRRSLWLAQRRRLGRTLIGDRRAEGPAELRQNPVVFARPHFFGHA